jgi:predicted MFS family arabinose efflux permease
VAEHVGFWVVFAVSGLPLLGVWPALVLARVLHEAPAAEDTGVPVPYLRLLRAMALLLGVTLAGGALITFIAQMSSSAVLTTTALLVMSATAAAARWRVGALADRHGAHPFIWPLVLLTAVGMAVIAFAVRDPGATSAVALLVGMAAVGLCYGGLQNLTLVVAFEAVTRKHYGQASAIWNIGFDTGTGLGSVVVGLVAAGTSFSTALLVAAGISLTTLPLALMRPGSRPAVRPARGGAAP